MTGARCSIECQRLALLRGGSQLGTVAARVGQAYYADKKPADSYLGLSNEPRPATGSQPAHNAHGLSTFD
jgi:hypothetical protein